MHSDSLLSRVGNGLLICALLNWSVRSTAGTQLPVPCVATACGTNAGSFVSSGKATAVQSGNKLTVSQTSGTATLNWASFNVSVDGKVVFQQPTSSSIALNRIFDANPSSIFGSLSANGQIYLINANGFLFGSGATVNVAGLIASSLNVADTTLSSGILSPLQQLKPALANTDNAGILLVDASGNPLPNTGSIVVQSGANLSAADGGRLLLAAPLVQNGGSLSAPDGQIILAAGQKVFLEASSDQSLRGLVVEVDGGGPNAGAITDGGVSGTPVPAGVANNGVVANQATGALSAPRGNITLTGLMVNQDGRVSATTSVSANGSIVLLAGNGSYAGGTSLAPTRGGTVEMGPQSLTEVLPDYADTATAVDLQTQLQSTIQITGQQVLMHGASIDAPSGLLNVTAAANPSVGPAGENPQSQIRIDAGTTIDLAGSDATLPMAANLVTVQLRSNEFADDPTQRNGALRGKTVTVDVRADGGNGTPIADLGSAIAAVGKTIAQRTETGGKASFQAEGDIVFDPAASIDVSGGATTYEGGTIQTSALIGANGQLYDIGSANPLLTYTGVVNPTLTQSYDKWGVSEVVPTPGLSHYESTYLQGSAAGSIQFAAPSLLLGGGLKGSAVSGPYQRGPVGSAVGDAAAGGTLTIGLPAGIGNNTTNIDFFSPTVTLTANPTPVVVADGAPLPVQSLQLPVSYLTSDGFTATQVYSNTSITLPPGLPLQLTPGASLLFEAPRIDIESSIAALGGKLSLENVLTVDSVAIPRSGIGIGNNVSFDVSGQWTNDSLLADGVGTTPTLQAGGSINLQLTAPGSELVLGDAVALKANGGAWLNVGGSVSYGAGGRITIDASPAQAALQFGQNLTLQGFGTGQATGATFSLLASRMQISEGNGSAWTAAQRIDDFYPLGQVLNLYAPLFSADGFSNIQLTATGAAVPTASTDVLTITPGTTIAAQISSWQLDPGFQALRSGGTVSGFTHAVTLPLYERPAASVSLSVLANGNDPIVTEADVGNLDLQAGSAILVDPGATVRLVGDGSVLIGGTVRAPGGTILVEIPAPTVDLGYQPTQGITLSPTALLDAGGTTVLTPNAFGLQQGSLFPGGSVSLLAVRGTVVADPGSSIDIAGASASLDIANPAQLSGYTRSVVASAGGSLTVSSGESISLLGTLSASAGSGNSGAAAAGSLEVDLLRSNVIAAGEPQYPTTALEIELIDSTAGTPPSPPDSDFAMLGVQQLSRSGVDSLTLRSPQGSIAIDTGQLALARQVTLDTPSLAVAADTVLSAPYVAIGNSVPGSTVPAPGAGSAAFTVSAQQINLFGNFALQDTASTTLWSAGDVQLQGTVTANSAKPSGSLVTTGNLTINAARVYPDTYTDFTIESQGSVAIGQKSFYGQTLGSLGAPLSAGGSASIEANDIAISGTLLAPFGSIHLAANDTLTLASGSVVSVSGAGLDVPYGQTQLNGAQWVYQIPGTVPTTVTGVPAKQVTLTAPNVTMQSGATVDVRGGGDLYAYEWVPGTGGTYDNLAAYGGAGGPVNESSIPNLYAILPGARGQAAPFDPQESGASNPNQTVYLSGGAGIAAGFYALLPARYALEPGAQLIQIQPGYVSASGGQIGALASGTPVIAGYLSTGMTGLHSGAGVGDLTEYEGFAIYPGGYARQLSAYTISPASSFFAAAAASAGTGPVALPADSGAFSLTVTQAADTALNLQGSVLTAAAAGGRGAQVNLNAPELEITAAGDSVAPDSIAVLGSVLQSWNAGTLTLGGTATASTTTVGSGTSTTSTIAVSATSVAVDTGVQLTADEINIVAQQSIDVRAGAVLSSTSGKAGTTLSTLPSNETVTLTDASGNALPQGALLAVSDLALPVVTRAPFAGSGGTITLEKGATLNSGGALAFDAPGDIVLNGAALNGKGASWSLSSGSVAFVGSGTSSDTLNIGNAVLSSLQQAGALRIASQGSIDLDSPVSLGIDASGTVPTLNSLVLSGNSINNQTTGNSTFGAVNLTLSGPAAVVAANPVAAATPGSGNLSFVADSLTVGPGALSVNGFGHTVAQIAGAVETNGAGYLNVGGDLTINAARLTPAPDAVDEPGTTLAATGTLTIGAPVAASAGGTLPTLVGGSLTLSAANIEDAGAIVAPSGVVIVYSIGNLHLASSATIDTSGTMLVANDQTAFSPGGIVQLNAGGNLNLDAGSLVAVAGNAAAPAGSLSIVGLGTVTASGTLNGAAAANTGGNLTVDAGQLSGGLSGLVGLAAPSGLSGFTNSVNVRVRTGDLDVASGSAITANQLTLTADSGAVDIAGVLNAPSAAQRGLIDLSGGTGVVLQASGQLHADGGGSSGRGGEIDINATCGTCAITLQSGGVVSATGAAQMGELVLRAPALTAAGDVAINVGSSGIGADVSRAGQVVVDPIMVSATSASTVNGDLATAIGNAAAYLSTATPVIAARLTGLGATPIAIQAGVELQDSNVGDTLSLQSLDLSPYSTAGQVINVGVRAAGTVALNGTMSDGFVIGGPSNDATVLTSAPSASFSLVAGADLSSANPLTVIRGSAAALSMGSTASPAVLRTGTGDLNLAAAGDVVFASGSSAYTAGTATTATPVSVTIPGTRGQQLMNFAADGGNVQIAAGGDVVGSPVVGDKGNFSVTGWQVRVGNSKSAAQYGIDFDTFDWNVGALGGGDVTVLAGGQMTNVSAAAADSLASAANSGNATATTYGAGGGLRMAAVGDIGSVQMFVADGAGTLTTGGGLTAIVPNGTGAGFVGSSIALGDAQLSVWARQSVQVDAVYNPTVVTSSGYTNTLNYFTYGADSALNLSSAGGNVTFALDANQYAMGALLGPGFIQGLHNDVIIDLPGNLSISALQQDVKLDGSGILFPSAHGQLVLFAGRDIASTGGSLSMADSFVSSYPTPASPGITLADGNTDTGGLSPFEGVIHTGDPTPALITAGRDISGVTLILPKAAQVTAGRDILNLVYQGQNTSARDTTLISAGRDMLNNQGSTGEIRVGGPGSVAVLAGRNLDLGLSDGITTVGNLENANLPSPAGADLTVAVGYGGQGVDSATFLNKVIAPSVDYQAQLIGFVEAQNGTSGLTFNQAQSAFESLTPLLQSALIDSVFFNELLLSGRAANSGTGVGFTEGYAAIDALFPNSRTATASGPDPYVGNLNLTFSQIYTLSGGNITILAPGGAIDVGLAHTPAGFTSKPASSLGIVAEGTGNVDIYSKGDVNVNASRIFTLGGGNILIWSNEGSIDAGNGSKSSLSVPPPVVLIQPDGTIQLDYAGSLASGSGIRTIQTNLSVAPGNVDLDAPVGTVNAGDAGIGSAGNINIAAAHVIGVDNINFGGTATGVPSDLSGLGASLSGVSAVASSATSSATSSVAESNAAKDTAPLAQTALSWLDVFVTGLGEENCKPDDIECLKRQKAAAH